MLKLCLDIIKTTKGEYKVKFLKRIFILLLAMSTFLSFSACERGEPSQIPSEQKELDKSKSYSVLFIGNSYTYYNSMPEVYFAELMSSAGYNVTVKSLTKGAQTLTSSADPTDVLGKKVDEELKSNKYDFVVLQEQSTRPILYPELFFSAVRALAEKVKENGASLILYGTWGHKEGKDTLETYGWTTESMMWQLAAAYEKIGRELGADVAYVGVAFLDVYQNNSFINLYHTDLTHPSPKGSYLAALTIFAEITHVDPTTVEYNGSNSKEFADILKNAAKKAVFATPEIPEEYR